MPSCLAIALMPISVAHSSITCASTLLLIRGCLSLTLAAFLSKAAVHALDDNDGLELGGGTEHLEHGLTGRSTRVECLLK